MILYESFLVFFLGMILVSLIITACKKSGTVGLKDINTYPIRPKAIQWMFEKIVADNPDADIGIVGKRESQLTHLLAVDGTETTLENGGNGCVTAKRSK